MGISKFSRVQQWRTFARQWHLIDARWQDVDKLGMRVAKHLSGTSKPIYHPETDCGDHVVVFNCADVALKGFDWKRREYMFNRGYFKSRNYLPAWEIHEADPCRIVYMGVYEHLPILFLKKLHIERLHLFPTSEIHPDILENVGNQLEPETRIPKKLSEYSEEEIENFPNLLDLPENFAANDLMAKPKKSTKDSR